MTTFVRRFSDLAEMLVRIQDVLIVTLCKYWERKGFASKTLNNEVPVPEVTRTVGLLTIHHKSSEMTPFTRSLSTIQSLQKMTKKIKDYVGIYVEVEHQNLTAQTIKTTTPPKIRCGIMTITALMHGELVLIALQ